MGPNGAEIIRVFTRQAGGTISDTTLDPSKDAEVVVEVEAGGTVYGVQGKYSTGLFVKDLIDGTLIPFTPAPAKGALGDPPWTPQATQITYTIKAADLANHKDHLCQVDAYVLIGGMPPFDPSFAVSPTFLILQ
jgi:hypothetical protein